MPVVTDERPQETLNITFLIVYLTAPPFFILESVAPTKKLEKK
jgi:hypothetical protein